MSNSWIDNLLPEEIQVPESLSEVQEMLSTIKGSLSHAVIEDREDRKSIAGLGLNVINPEE